MTLPPVVRVFFAIGLAPEMKESLGQFTSALKKKAKPHTIRWVRPENLHITLQFLAEARSEDLGVLVDKVTSALAGLPRQSALTLKGLQLFPNPYRPRVIVLEVSPQDGLARLAEHIGVGMRAIGYAVEDRPFRGHLTLGRIKLPKDLDLRFLSEASVPDFGQIALSEVVLYRSEPRPEGSLYTEVAKITLRV